MAKNIEQTNTTGLISKLAAMWKENKHRAKAYIASGLIAASLTSCTPIDVNPSHTTGPNTSTTQPVEQGSTSEILRAVLENDYYRNVASDYAVNGHFANQKFNPVPYGYLEQMGHDINAIKNNEIKCFSQLYTKESAKNSLFVATRVECNDASQPYYACYTLEYKLSDKEMAEFLDIAYANYFEAILFLQEASYQKTPTVLGNTAVTVEEFEDIKEEFEKYEVAKTIFGTNKIAIDLLGFNQEDKTLQIQVRRPP